VLRSSVERLEMGRATDTGRREGDREEERAGEPAFVVAVGDAAGDLLPIVATTLVFFVCVCPFAHAAGDVQRRLKKRKEVTRLRCFHDDLTMPMSGYMDAQPFSAKSFSLNAHKFAAKAASLPDVLHGDSRAMGTK